jgi:uncharacterized membrane protein
MIPMKKPSRADAVSLLLVVLAFLFALWMYPRLPRAVPVHWNLRGQVNGTMDKPWGVFLGPLGMVGIWLLLALLPRISPAGFRMEGFRTSYDVVRIAIVGFLFVVSVVTLLGASGYSLPMGEMISVLVGLLIVVLGNFMPKFRKNFFVGIRTPWTLGDDDVWYCTHRLAGWLFVLGGLALIVEALLRGSPLWFFATLAALVLVPFVFSYTTYRRLHNEGRPRPGPG